MPHSLPLPELRGWLALSRLPGVGGARLRALVARHGGAEGAYAAGPRAWRGAGLERAADARVDLARIEADLEWLADPRHHLLPFSGADYPPLLARIADAPALLYVRGDPLRLWRAQLAVVGSRSASAGGLANARMFAVALVAAGLAITSGLAGGIDGAAHAAALDAGGATIAVCGTGLDVVYPARHEALAARIAERDALVSELPLGTPARPDHFPRRNRIIAGLSLGTLVVEAGLKSGSLITARLAGDQGREVFAVPASIHAPNARGCHHLLRQGAVLVESIDDVLAELGPLARALGEDLAARLHAAGALASPTAGAHACRDPGSVPAPPRDEVRLLRALGHDPLSVDEIVTRSGLTAAAVSSMLTVLELDGVVAAQAGARYVRLAR